MNNKVMPRENVYFRVCANNLDPDCAYAQVDQSLFSHNFPHFLEKMNIYQSVWEILSFKGCDLMFAPQDDKNIKA